MSKFGDFMINLHKICQTPMNCQFFKKFLALLTAQETFINSSSSPEKFLFYTDKIEFIEWPDLEQRQRTGDCSVIHLPP